MGWNNMPYPVFKRPKHLPCSSASHYY